MSYIQLYCNLHCIYTVTGSVAMHGSGHLNATYKSHRHTASILHGHIQPSTKAYTKSINLFMVRLGEAIYATAVLSSCTCTTLHWSSVQWTTEPFKETKVSSKQERNQLTRLKNCLGSIQHLHTNQLDQVHFKPLLCAPSLVLEVL